MKRKSPMQMKKAETSKKKRGKTNEPTMEEYAAQRKQKLQPMSIGSVSTGLKMYDHDPESDLHTLSRAQEITSNPRRHANVKAVAKQKMKTMAQLMGKSSS